MPTAPLDSRPLIDGFGRRIDYVRLSVTDRCDLRCRYCMAERMDFLPNSALLTIAELAELGTILIGRGVRRIRLTGGEPLVRRGLLDLVRVLGGRIGRGLDELTLTTNGTQLAGAAGALADAGVRRINVSLDSLDPDRFRAITRRGDLSRVLEGIDAAVAVGLTVKINMVALKGLNDGEIAPMLAWCGARGFDLSLIETMPLGQIGESRAERYLPLSEAREMLERRFTLIPTTYRTGGPSRYFEVTETGTRVGFITPLSDNFCAGCNRVRITATGTLYPCLGHARKIELREALRVGDRAEVNAALDRALAAKPRAHEFDIDRVEPAIARHMSVTGG